MNKSVCESIHGWQFKFKAIPRSRSRDLINFTSTCGDENMDLKVLKDHLFASQNRLKILLEVRCKEIKNFTWEKIFESNSSNSF